MAIPLTPTTLFSAANTLVDLLNNFSAVDVVGIFSGTSQVFINARPLRAEIRETSKVMVHPVETGVTVADNHIINPIEINISFMIQSQDYSAIYTQIKQSFLAATSFTIQTRTANYANMIIENMPHSETPEVYNAIVMAINFKEVLIIPPVSVSTTAAPANFSPTSPANSNTVSAGLKYPAALSNSNTSAVQSIFTGLAFKNLGGKL